MDFYIFLKIILKRRRESYVSRNVTDEQQYDMHSDLITIHKYKTEEEAKENLILTNNGISHVGDEFWVADENILTTTIEESIKHVCDNFKVKVPIGIEFNVGTNWSECH